MLLRGECVVSVAVESAPPPKKGKRTAAQAGLPPMAQRAAAMGRGMTLPAPGLAGPVPGLGGPSLAAMQPQLSSNPQMYPAPVYGQPMPPMAAYGRGIPVGGMPPPAQAYPTMGRGAPVQPPFGRGAVSFTTIPVESQLVFGLQPRSNYWR